MRVLLGIACIGGLLFTAAGCSNQAGGPAAANDVKAFKGAAMPPEVQQRIQARQQQATSHTSGGSVVK